MYSVHALSFSELQLMRKFYKGIQGNTICVCVRICTHTNTYTPIHIGLHTHIEYRSTHRPTKMFAHLHANTYAHTVCTHPYARAHFLSRTRLNNHGRQRERHMPRLQHALTCTHTHTHTRTHAHAHAHAQTQTMPRPALHKPKTTELTNPSAAANRYQVLNRKPPE